MQRARSAVLLVEDGPIHARLIEKLLGQVVGYDFDATTDECFRLALVQLRKTHIDLVLLDLVLPDGQALSPFFRARAVAPQLPILILIVTDDAAFTAKAVEEGAQAYLSKVNKAIQPVTPAKSSRGVFP